jgi:hypothetical protein
MKIRITAYTFDASAGTIKFTGVNPIILEGVLLIVNVTDDIIIYSPFNPLRGGSVTTDTLTLIYDTSLMDDADKLLIYYDEPVQTISTNVTATLATGTAEIGNVKNSGTFATQSTDSVNTTSGLTIKVAYTASQTGTTVLTPTGGKKVCITDITISASGTGTIKLFDSTDSSSTSIGPTLSLVINGGWEKEFRKPWVSAATDNVIKYTSSAGAAGSIWIQYYEV